MSLINLILNVIWFVLGGLFMALGWYLAGLIMLVTIVGSPWALACFRIGTFSLWPFGRVVTRREEGFGSGTLGLVMNIVWFVLAGWWLAIGHLMSALANAVTIIGLPFAWQHVKLAQLTLAPVGAEAVPSDEAVLKQPVQQGPR